MTRRYTLKTGSARPSKLSLETELNEAQRRAVETDAARVLILAGAGSGKTRTLTFRVARLIEKGEPPEGIVLVTFTNRAAREMTARVDRLLGPEARRVRAGTFHGLAHAALRRNGAALGWRPGFGIIDREDQAQVMSAAIGDAGVDVKARRFPSPDLLASIVSLAVNASVKPIDMIIRRFVHFAPLEDAIDAVLEHYTRRKREMNVLDFDDLLLEWRALLGRGDALAARLRGEVRHVLVDEFQDTNRLQAELAELLSAESQNLCVVGDDAQSIYSFRGAEFENILNFPRRADTEVHQLTTNYRSTPQILVLANEVIKKNPLQFPKDLVARRGAGVLPVLVPARDPLQQGEFIAQRVLELRDEGVPLRDQAVLYRAHSHSVELQVELARRDIPFILRSGIRFFEQAHVKDALAFLRVVANPFDELAWRRVLDVLPGVGTRTAAKVWEHVRTSAARGADPLRCLADPELLAAVPARAAQPFTALVSALASISAPAMRTAPGEMIRVLLRNDGVTASLLADHFASAYPNASVRVEELLQLAEIAAQHEDLDGFLSEVVLVSELTGEDAAGAPPTGDEWLTLSTVHQAKGLEWRAVFVAGLADGAFPIQTALEESGGEAEERRLFYVAVTRSMEQLYLTYPGSRFVREDERVLQRPSRFISELATASGLYEKWLLEAPR